MTIMWMKIMLLLLLLLFFFLVHPAGILIVALFFFSPSFPASFPCLACKNIPDHSISSRHNESHPYVSHGDMHESCQSWRARTEQCICTTFAQDLNESAHRSTDETLISQHRHMTLPYWALPVCSYAKPNQSVFIVPRSDRINYLFLA